MYDDPRDVAPNDKHDILTEDSDDAFADLEKEYAVKRQKLMEERARKRERSQNPLQVERSPSPTGFRKTPQILAHGHPSKLLEGNSRLAVELPQLPKAPQRTFKRVPPVSSTQFAKRLFENENQNSKVNYNERVFEFPNLPKGEPVLLNEQNSRDLTSGELLRRRLIAESDVERLLKNTKVLRVSKLLAKIVPPKYEEPVYPNWCLPGIIIYKSDPKTASSGKKYLTLRVGTFNLTVDVFLFGDAFQKYWKLRCGDVIAILNPTVKKHGSGFNLSLQDNLDCILEIGSLKNFGYCSGINKEGAACKYVIDLLKNDLCSFHEESKFKRGSRMELQGSVKPKAPKNKLGHSSQAFVNKTTNKPLFVQYLNAGFLEKDTVYDGGEQFDQSKYDRPVKENEAAKLRKRKANEKLRLQLLNSAPPNRLNDLDKLGIVPQLELEKIKRQNSLLKIKLQAFKNTFLKGMGYDPTFEKSQQLDKIKPTESMEELRSISKSKKISLKPSDEDKKKKLTQQKTAMRIIKPNVSAIQQPAIFGPGRRLHPGNSPLKSPPKIKNVLDDEKKHKFGVCGGTDGNHDSDSDLEISFTCDADKARYNKVIMGSPRRT